MFIRMKEGSLVSINIRYDGNWVYGSMRRGWHPSASPRLAKLLKGQHGRWRYCQRCFHHDDRLETDPINGNRHHAH